MGGLAETQADVLGGFNWSSQHLDRGRCCDGQASGVDGGVDGAGADEVAGAAVAAAEVRERFWREIAEGLTSEEAGVRGRRVGGGWQPVVP